MGCRSDALTAFVQLISAPTGCSTRAWRVDCVARRPGTARSQYSESHAARDLPRKTCRKTCTEDPVSLLQRRQHLGARVGDGEVGRAHAGECRPATLLNEGVLLPQTD